MAEPSLPVLFLPGLDGAGRLFAPLLAELTEAFEPRVVAYPRIAFSGMRRSSRLSRRTFRQDGASSCSVSRSPARSRFASQRRHRRASRPWSRSRLFTSVPCHRGSRPCGQRWEPSSHTLCRPSLSGACSPAPKPRTRSSRRFGRRRLQSNPRCLLRGHALRWTWTHRMHSPPAACRCFTSAAPRIAFSVAPFLARFARSSLGGGSIPAGAPPRPAAPAARGGGGAQRLLDAGCLTRPC
jgi:hypothetical protein